MKKVVSYFVLGLLMFSCTEKRESFVVTEKPMVVSVYASGKVKAKNQYTLYAVTSGVLKKVWVKPGQLVNQGEQLFSINHENAQLGVQNAQSVLNYSKSTLNEKLKEAELTVATAFEKFKLDESLYAKQKKLWQQQIGSLIELEQKKLAWITSENNYKNAVNRLEQLKKTLATEVERNTIAYEMSNTLQNDFSIKSALKGKVFDVLVKEGTLITPQLPLAVLGDAQDFYLELEVDENDMVKIELGQVVMVTMDSYKGQVFEASITQINPLMNERNRTFTVEAAFKKMPLKLYPNLTVEANIVVQTKKQALVIPKAYVSAGDSVELNTNQKRKISIGDADFEYVEVLSGLKKSETILKPE